MFLQTDSCSQFVASVGTAHYKRPLHAGANDNVFDAGVAIKTPRWRNRWGVGVAGTPAWSPITTGQAGSATSTHGRRETIN